MSNSVNITGSDFDQLYNALDKVAKRSAQATRFMGRMFNTDYNNGRIFASLNKLSGSLAISITRVRSLQSALRELKGVSVGTVRVGGAVAAGGGGSGGGGGRSAGSDFVPLMRVKSNAIAFTQDFLDSNKKYMDKLRAANAATEKARQREEARAAAIKERQARRDAVLAEKQARLLGKEGSDTFVGPSRKAFEANQRRLAAQQAKIDKNSFVSSLSVSNNLEKYALAEAKKKLAQSKQLERINQQRAKAAQDALKAEQQVAESARRDAARARQGGLFGLLVRSQEMRYRQDRALERTFPFKTNLSMDNKGMPWLSKFGNPGQMPLYSRFRVFQRPFPGSERNPFALGDASNLLNNAIYGTFTAVRGIFDGITTAGTDVVRLFSGLTQVGLSSLSYFTSFLKSIPGVEMIGGMLSKTLAALVPLVSAVTDAFTGLVDSLSKVVGEAITALGMFALGVAGFASRAVQAASNLTELRNAAQIYVGGGSKGLFDTSTEYQMKYGLSAADSLRLMTRVAGQLRQTTGASSDAAAKQAQEIFKSAADAGSVLNMNMDDIGKIVQSALAGRYTPLRRIGVAVSAPYLDAIAAQKGFAKNAATPFAARAMALQFEIARQTQPFRQDLEATQYEFANQQRKILGMFEAGFVQVGRVLEPFARLLLIATNAVAELFVNKLKSFADAVEAAVEDMKQGIFGGWIQDKILQFARVVAQAADFVMALAKALFAARWQILDNAINLGRSLAQLGRNLLDFSLKMISALAAVSSVLESFAYQWGTSKEQKAKDNAAAELAFANAKAKATAQEPVLTALKMDWANKGPQTQGWTQAQFDAKVKPMEELAKKVQMVETGEAVLQREFGPRAEFGNLSKKANDIVVGARDGIANADVMFKTLWDKLKVAPNPQVAQDLLDKFLMQHGRVPQFANPEEIMAKPGPLSQYFTPAAYRDEISTREVDAAEQTAQNTNQMAMALNQIAGVIVGKGGPMEDLLHPRGVLGILAR